MQARLKVLHDKANVKQVKLLPVTLIGRSTECNLKIASSQVSRNHCRITLADDAVFVEDLGSANGTLVDGQPLPAHQPTAIAPGTHLIVGPAEFQIDFVAPSSPTLVLNRSSSPVAPELPSTEMIFPVTSPNASFPAVAPAAIVAQAASEAAVAPVPVATPAIVAQEVVAAPAVAAPYVPVAAPVEAPFIPQAPAVAEWQPPVESAANLTEMSPPAAGVPVVAAVPVLDVAAVAARAADTEILDSGAQAFGFEADEEAAQATQFMFAETVPDSIPFESSADTSAPPKSEAAAKKGGLKSLFSLFGRKDKATGATHSASVTPPAASAPPSVFLPTVEPQSQSEELAVEVVSEVVNIEQLGVEVDSSTDTAEFTGEQPPPTSTDENDDFQQFLSQF